MWHATHGDSPGVRLVIVLVGLGSLFNAGWMLLWPHHWYAYVPADVPDYGPYNAHLVKDLGCAFLVVGLMLGWAWRDAGMRLPFTVAPGAFYVAHSFIHVYDTGFGLVETNHWLVDLPLTYLPAALLVGAVVALRGAKLGPRSAVE